MQAAIPENLCSQEEKNSAFLVQSEFPLKSMKSLPE